MPRRRQRGLWLRVLLVGSGAFAALPAVLAAQVRSVPEQPAPPARISVALLDVSVATALETLSAVGRLNVVWQAATLGARAQSRVSCRMSEVPPEQVLACITRAAGLDYVRLSSGTYVVIAGTEAIAGMASFAGIVVDAATGMPLPEARVHLAERSQPALSKDDGGFSFQQLPPGEYAVTVRAIGYRPYSTTFAVQPRDQRVMRMSLERTDAVARPIIVNGIRPGATSAALGNASLTGRSADRLVSGPSLFLPGAVAPLGITRRDGTGDLHLQGGDVGEHPWRLDGVPLYDVNALSGLLGVVSPIVLERMTVRRSGFDATHGSFATGVIDLEHAIAPTDREGGRGEVQVDPLAASARWSSPLSIGGGDGHVMVGGRTGLWQYTAPAAMTRALRHWSVPDPVLLARLSGFAALPGMSDLDRTPYATSLGDERVTTNDVHVAGRLRWDVAHELHASAFASSNGVSYDGTALHDGPSATATLQSNEAYRWQTAGGQLTHRWLLGTRVRHQLRLRASTHTLRHTAGMQMQAVPQTSVRADEENGIDEMAIESQWRLSAGARTDVQLGAEVARTSARLELGNRVLRPLSYTTDVVRGAALANASVLLARGTHLDAGVRITQLQNGRTYAEPRFALRGEQTDGAHPWSWRLAGGGYHQFVNQFDVASTMPVGIVPAVRFWLPSDGALPVAQAWHTTAEAVLRLGDNWELRGESYARWQPAIPMFDYGVMYDGTGVNSAAAGARFVAASNGRAAGGGVRLIRDGAIRGVGMRSELAYDAGWAERTFPSRFGGARQPPPWLEPHRVLLALEARPVKGLVLATRTRGVWGRPWALRQVYYDLFGAAPMQSGLPIDMPQQMQRPVVLDLDVGLTYRRALRQGAFEVGLSVTNLLDRANVLDFGLRRSATSAVYDMVPRLMPGRQPALSFRWSPQ